MARSAGGYDLSRYESSLCQGVFFVDVWARAFAPWRDGVVGRSVMSGPGSDLTEEPALRDVEPVTLAAESFPFVLLGPSAPGAFRVGEQLAVDGVAHMTFEHA